MPRGQPCLWTGLPLTRVLPLTQTLSTNPTSCPCIHIYLFIYLYNYIIYIHIFSDPCTTFTFPDPYDYPDCLSFCIHDSTCTAIIKSVLSVTACNSRTTLPTVGTSSLAAPPPAGSTDLAILGDACSWPPEYVRRAWLSYLLRRRLRLC